MALRLADKLHYKKISLDRLDELKEMTAQEVLKEAGISLLRLPYIAYHFRKEFKKGVSQLNPISGMRETLFELSKNYRMGILTSNSEDNVNEFLTNHNLLNLFEFVYTERKAFGKSKKLSSLIKKYKYTKNNIIYVGDETRDIEASKDCGIRVISVTWGFNSSRILEKFKPDCMAQQPSDLISLVTMLENQTTGINA